MIACFIRYELDPLKTAEFEHYARAWRQAIPECGADLIGYFAPHEGSATVGYGVYTIESLAAYEVYRTRLKEHDAARDNFAFAKRERFIRREDRLFLRPVAGPRA